VVSDILSHFRTKPYGTPIPWALEDDVLHFGMAINMSSMLRIVEFSMRCHSYLRSFALIDSPNLQPAVRAMMGPAPIKKTLCLHLHGYIAMYIILYIYTYYVMYIYTPLCIYNVYLHIYMYILCKYVHIYIYTLPIWICKYLRYPSMQWIVSAVDPDPRPGTHRCVSHFRVGRRLEKKELVSLIWVDHLGKYNG
jgi:hypothetical protein